MAGRALPYNTMKAEAQDRDGRKAMGEEKERNERRSGKGWERIWRKMGEEVEKDERRSGKGWEKKRKEMGEGAESDGRRSGKRWEKERKEMGEGTESDERRSGKRWEKKQKEMGEGDRSHAPTICTTAGLQMQCAASVIAACCKRQRSALHRAMQHAAFFRP